jgi:hypothetical protein
VRIPSRYSSNTPPLLLPSKVVINRTNRDDITNNISKSLGLLPPQTLGPKMTFHIEHFLWILDGTIIKYDYLQHQWSHSVKIPLGQLRVCSHQLRVDTNNCIPCTKRVCRLCSHQEVENEEHFNFQYPIYNKI